MNTMMGNMKREKIVWLSFLPAIHVRGLTTTARVEMLRHLARRNDVFLVGPHPTIKDRLGNSDIHVTTIPIKNPTMISRLVFNFILFFFFPFYSIILRPDFIITTPDGTIFGLFSTLLLKTFLGDRGFKVVLDIRTTPIGTRTRVHFPFQFHFTVSMASKMFDGMTIITSMMKKEICQKFGIDPNSVGIWPVGALPTLFDPERWASEGNILREKLGVLNKFIVLYHGVFSSNRGLIETANAFQLVKHKHQDIVLFLLGRGPIVPYLKKLVQEKELQNNVIIHDAVDYLDVPKYITMCDVEIVPLPNISFWRHQCPLKLLECLAMKKVAIITDIPAHREIVGDKKCGVYISSIDPSEIANAVTYVYENRSKLEEWGATGREIITSKYNWENAAKDLENYLSSLQRTRIK